MGPGTTPGLSFDPARSRLIVKGLMWLAEPIFLVPEYVFIAAAAGIGLTVSITGGSIKKYM